jgi:hypothetical protein
MDKIEGSECEGTETYINFTDIIHVLSICVHVSYRPISTHGPPEVKH